MSGTRWPIFFFLLRQEKKKKSLSYLMDVGSNVYILDDYQEFVLTVLFL